MPTRRACWAATAGAPWTISTFTAGSRSRWARCPRPSACSAATSPARGPARAAHPAGPAVPLLDLAPAGRRGRLPGRDPRPRGGAGAGRAAVGEHASLQGRAGAPRLRHRRLGDADHARSSWATRRSPSASPTASSTPASGRPASSIPPSLWTGPGCARSSRPPTPTRSWTPAWRPSRASAGSWAHRRVSERAAPPADAGLPGSRRPRSTGTCRSTPTSTRTSRRTATCPWTSTAPRPWPAASASWRSPTTSTSIRGRRPTPSPASSARADRPGGRREVGRSRLAIRFGVEITCESADEDDIREHLATHPYDYVIGSVHALRRLAPDGARVAAWGAGGRRPGRRALLRGGAGGHPERALRHPRAPRLRQEVRRRARAAGGLRGRAPTSTSPCSSPWSRRGPPWRSTRRGCARPPTRRIRGAGGRPLPGAGRQRVTAGSDAHRAGWFAFGLARAYAALAPPVSPRSRPRARPATPGGERLPIPSGAAAAPAPRSCAGRPAGGTANLSAWSSSSSAPAPPTPTGRGQRPPLRRVAWAGTTLALDIGQGVFAGIAGRIEPAELLAVMVSHLHPDHFVDLVALRHYLRYEFDPPGRVRVIDLPAWRRGWTGSGPSPDFSMATLDVEARSEGEMAVGPFRVESRRVTHTAESYGVRGYARGRRHRRGGPRLQRRLRPRGGPGCAGPAGRHDPERGGLRAGSGPGAGPPPRRAGGGPARPPHRGRRASSSPTSRCGRDPLARDRGQRPPRVRGPGRRWCRGRGSGDDSRADAPHRCVQLGQLKLQRCTPAAGN